MMVDRIRLIGELARSVEGRAILFVNRKADADLICDFRDELGVRARPLHGDLSQAARGPLSWTTSGEANSRCWSARTDTLTRGAGKGRRSRGGDRPCASGEAGLDGCRRAAMNTAQHRRDHSSRGL